MKKIKCFMKGLVPVLLCALLPLLSACSDNDDISLYDVAVQLSYPENSEPYAGAPVELRNTTGAGLYQATTDASGKAVFHVPAGVYEVTTADVREAEGFRYICNGTLAQLVVQDGVAASATVQVNVAKMNTEHPIIIKEIYNGGVWNTATNKNFIQDKCIILYNNSNEDVTMDNLAITIGPGYNAEASSTQKLYADGKLHYADEDWIPGYAGIWYFQGAVTIPAFSQLVVNVHGAINNTQVDGLANSVNYANADYYCMYDPDYEGPGTSANNKFFNNTSYYPTPADVIPTSHYLKTVKLAQGNAWPMSVTSPAVMIYQTKGTTPKAHAENADNAYTHLGYSGPTWGGTKIPREWILDGVEVWKAGSESASVKRLTDDIDVGHVSLTNAQGHVLYRNVDKTSTEALPENAGKLVYNYSLGVESSTDPSGINAEASMKNGAHIIFMDTNNSSVDFHERQKCSLRGE